MPAKKYQIFVSSTKEDLSSERQAVYETILDLGHIPSGMEWFPSSDLSQWDNITKQLENTDYVILISAVMYGSIVPNECISWTEKEFDYCLSQGIPVHSFLYEVIDNLKGKLIDTEHRAELEKFRKKLSDGRLRQTYTTPDNLRAKVAAALTQAFADLPRIGWIRANEMDQTDSSVEIEELKKKVALLEDSATMHVV